MKEKLRFCFLALALLLSKAATSQDLPLGFKNWIKAGVDLELSKKLTLGISQMTSMETRPYSFGFSQWNFSGEYRLRKYTYLESGYEPLFLRSGNSIEAIHKIYAGLTLRKIAGLPIRQNVEAEWFLPQQKKFRYRFSYSLSYSLKNDFLPWDGRPFAKAQVTYYLGGKPLTYYDENQEVLAKHAPNDFHRFRFTCGVSMKPAKSLKLNVYFLWNKEFNSPFTQTRDINIPSKQGSKIKYPFNDYALLGVSVNYELKLYSNEKHPTKKNHHHKRR